MEDCHSRHCSHQYHEQEIRFQWQLLSTPSELNNSCFIPTLHISGKYFLWSKVTSNPLREGILGNVVLAKLNWGSAKPLHWSRTWCSPIVMLSLSWTHKGHISQHPLQLGGDTLLGFLGGFFQSFLRVVFVLFCWPHCTAYGISVFLIQPGIKPMPPAVETQNLDSWTVRVVPRFIFHWGNFVL